MMSSFERIYAKIDLDAVEENFRLMRAGMKEDTEMIAVIKTDAYGHGALPIARLVEAYEYIWGFAVATVEEAVFLRKNGIQKPILILGFVFPQDYEILAEYEIRPAVFKLSMAKELSAAAEKRGKKIRIHLALDTGMTRIGFADTDASVEVIKKIADLPGL